MKTFSEWVKNLKESMQSGMNAMNNMQSRIQGQYNDINKSFPGALPKTPSREKVFGAPPSNYEDRFGDEGNSQAKQEYAPMNGQFGLYSIMSALEGAVQTKQITPQIVQTYINRALEIMMHYTGPNGEATGIAKNAADVHREWDVNRGKMFNRSSETDRIMNMPSHENMHMKLPMSGVGENIVMKTIQLIKAYGAKAKNSSQNNQ